MDEKSSPSSKIPVFERIRKPETRTEYSNILRDILREYLNEIFDCDSDFAKEMKGKKCLIVFEGSILRGNATEVTNDIDFFILEDVPELSEAEFKAERVKFQNLEKHHPQNIGFSEYFVTKLGENEEYLPYYQARLKELQRQWNYFNRMNNYPPEKVSTDPYSVVHIDAVFNTLKEIIKAIEDADLNRLFKNDTPSRIILSILSSGTDLVYETVSGSLQDYQKAIVKALLELQNSKPDQFNLLWKQLESDFKSLHRSTEFRDKLRDYKLLAWYYLKKRKFIVEHFKEEELIMIVANFLCEEAIRDEYIANLATHYKDIPDRLFSSMLAKYGLKTGLSGEQLQEVLNGNGPGRMRINSLSHEQQVEFSEFRRRIQLLIAIREAETMPTLSELTKAFIE